MKSFGDMILGLKAFLGADKKRAAAILLAAFGILLILFSLGGAEDGAAADTGMISREVLEDSVCELLSDIDGVGRCRVALSLASGERLEYKNGSLVYKEPARVSGAVVVCEGADDPSVVREINDALSALFDIGTNRISVQKMK